jgi:hypothetical protein
MPPIPTENLRYDDQTLVKVANAMRKAGLNGTQISNAINEILNAGIVFRERVE